MSFASFRLRLSVRNIFRRPRYTTALQRQVPYLVVVQRLFYKPRYVHKARLLPKQVRAERDCVWERPAIGHRQPRAATASGHVIHSQLDNYSELCVVDVR